MFDPYAHKDTHRIVAMQVSELRKATEDVRVAERDYAKMKRWLYCRGTMNVKDALQVVHIEHGHLHVLGNYKSLAYLLQDVRDVAIVPHPDAPQPLRWVEEYERISVKLGNFVSGRSVSFESVCGALQNYLVDEGIGRLLISERLSMRDGVVFRISDGGVYRSVVDMWDKLHKSFTGVNEATRLPKTCDAEFWISIAPQETPELEDARRARYELLCEQSEYYRKHTRWHEWKTPPRRQRMQVHNALKDAANLYNSGYEVDDYDERVVMNQLDRPGYDV